MKHYIKILHPKYWHLLDDYSPFVDELYKKELEKGLTFKFHEYRSNHKIVMNNHEVWLGASLFTSLQVTIGNQQFRPSRVTISRFYEQYNKWLKTQQTFDEKEFLEKWNEKSS